jgi:hypothetical protein
MAKDAKLTEGDIGFQDMGLENKETIGEPTKPITSKAISTMKPKESMESQMDESLIEADTQSGDHVKKDYPITPGAFSMEQQVPAEFAPHVSRTKRARITEATETIKDRTKVSENKEPFFEKRYGLDPDQDDELFWNSVDDLLLDDDLIDVNKYVDLQKAHLIGPEQNIALGAKQLAENLERDLYTSLRKTVNEWFGGVTPTTDMDDAMVSLRKQLIRWNQNLSKDTLTGLHDLVDLGVKAGVRKSKVPVPMKFYNKVNVTSFSQKGIMPAIQRFSDDVFVKASSAAKKHKMGSFRQKRAVDSELRKMRNRTKLMLRTEASRWGNLGMLEAFNYDPEKYRYKYYWRNPLDARSKTISKMRAKGNPYNLDSLLFLWKNQEQMIDGKWENDVFYQRCSIYRGEKMDKEWKGNIFSGREAEFRESL